MTWLFAIQFKHETSLVCMIHTKSDVHATCRYLGPGAHGGQHPKTLVFVQDKRTDGKTDKPADGQEDRHRQTDQQQYKNRFVDGQNIKW